MSCAACDDAADGNVAYPFRVGNDELGYGTVLIYACRPHAQLVMERLRYAAQADTGAKGSSDASPVEDHPDS